ncbi:MAG: hypothetical protein GEU77_10085 [Deltaproteobacteria bacterium]|nr:hypothetical protein [Deltaproteobacteria bacterium]
MKPSGRTTVAGVSFLFLLSVTAGCESIALLPRQPVEDVDRRSGVDRDGNDRSRDSVIDRPRDRSANEITGTVQKVDQSRREIHLRTTDAKMMVIKYDPATAVFNREKEIPLDSLRYGDLILVKVVKNNRGEQYADLIRIAS